MGGQVLIYSMWGHDWRINMQACCSTVGGSLLSAAASSLLGSGLQAGIGSKLAQVVEAVASTFGEQPQASIWSALLRQVR